MARMKTGRMSSPKTVDPVTGARIADPAQNGKKDGYGGTVSNWPAVRQQYRKGVNRDIIVNSKTPKEVRDYITGKTNILSEKYSEPTVARKGLNYSTDNDFIDPNPVKKVDPPVKKVDPPVKKEEKSEEITFNKLPLRKPSKIETSTKGNFNKKEIEKPEPSAFKNPGRNIKDVKVKTGAAFTSGLVKDRGRSGVGSNSRDAGLKAARAVKGEKKIYDRGYNKEEKRFKAYAGTTATGDSFIDMTPSEIRDYRGKAKSARAEYRKQPDSESKAVGKAAMTSEIRQSRKAEKFSEKVYDLKGKGGVKHFTDKNYGGNIIKDYKSSQDNVNNRNTIDAKLKAIGEKESKRLSNLEKSTRGGFQYNQINK